MLVVWMNPLAYSLRAPRSVLASVALLFWMGCGDPAPERASLEGPSQPTLDRPAAATLLEREPCSNRDALRRPLFGDLHVHTSFSMDAYLFDTRTTPADAYRFAKGEAIAVAPLDGKGRPTTRRQIDRPLDFAAITDHAENFGGVSRCTRPDSDVYETASCRTYRGEQVEARQRTFLETVAFVRERAAAIDADEVCGLDGRLCRDAVDDFWLETQRAAEAHYDRSAACRFTTFVAYEYSLSPSLSKVHRNVIFRNEIALDRPIHALDEPEPLSMLRRLRDECNDGKPGCEALAIPHNPNLSDGRMFRAEYPGTMNELQEARMARLRSEMEPVVEIMQIKGDSECRNGLSGVGGAVDELCDFEKMREMGPRPPPDCEGQIGAGALVGGGCVDRNDFARTALIAGLAEERRIGANPFRFGFIAATDEHDGTMGDVGEWTRSRDGGNGRETANTNPGGLVGVYAEENSRDALFDALKRRETFGTSGPRIAPRFFAGWGLEASLCEDPNGIAKAYETGVPMGGVLPDEAGRDQQPPTFLASALHDAGTTEHPGNRLERIQIVKGWLGEQGRYETQVVDIAGEETREDDLDLLSCAPSGAGHAALCGVWTDPEFDAAEHAVYYARVVEMPSCRWTTRRCNALPEAGRPPECEDPRIPKRVRERAWTSPIWYQPATGTPTESR